MFKSGDKVVCINSGEIIIKNNFNFILPIKYIKENQIYIVINENGGNEDLSLKEIGYNTYYRWERFISLAEYRKQKIKKICSKLEIK